METITVPNFRTNKEIAEMFGCTPEYIRKLKSTRAEDLAGLWDNNNPDGETVWTEEGVEKLSQMISTDKAKEYRAGALARRTQEAIAVDRAELNYANEQTSTRAGHEVSSYEIPNTTASGGRYADMPERVGDMIGSTLADPEGIRRMDTQVVKSFLKAVNLSDINIDIEALLGKQS